MKAQFNFSGDVQLTYQLNDTQTAADWAKKISSLTPASLKQNELNHCHGFATTEEIANRSARLEELAGILEIPFNGTSQEALNILHISFPKLHRAQQSVIRRMPQFRKVMQHAHELNLTIHWLEHEMYNQQLFNIDFNHDRAAWEMKQKFPVEEMSNFTTDFAFGDLHLHYIYIGRHFYEMFLANDVVCPSNQFHPQHEFNATCGLVFREPQEPFDMKPYYDLRGKEFFKYDFNDPMLAKGFFKLGQLEGYESLTERDELRNKLKTCSLISWQVL